METRKQRRLEAKKKWKEEGKKEVLLNFGISNLKLN